MRVVSFYPGYKKCKITPRSKYIYISKVTSFHPSLVTDGKQVGQASALKQSMESFEGAFNRHVKGNEKNNLTKAPESRSKVRASAPLCSLDAHAAWDNLCETLLIPDLVPKGGDWMWWQASGPHWCPMFQYSCI